MVSLSTFDDAYSQLVNSLEATSQDHASLSEVLISQVADATKTLEKKHEDMKNKQYQFYQKLLSDRDKIYAERIKVCSLGLYEKCLINLRHHSR